MRSFTNKITNEKDTGLSQNEVCVWVRKGRKISEAVWFDAVTVTTSIDKM